MTTKFAWGERLYISRHLKHHEAFKINQTSRSIFQGLDEITQCRNKIQSAITFHLVPKLLP